MSSQFPEGPEQYSVHAEAPSHEVTPEQESVVVRAVSALGNKMEILGRKLGRVETLAKRTKRLTLWIIGIGVGALAAIVGVLIVFGVAIAAKNTADNNQSYLVASCGAANQTRADQRELWGAIITVSSQSGANMDPVAQLLISKGVFTQEEYTAAVDSPVAEAGTNFIKDKVATIFADRDCSKVAHGKVS